MYFPFFSSLRPFGSISVLTKQSFCRYVLKKQHENTYDSAAPHSSSSSSSGVGASSSFGAGSVSVGGPPGTAAEELRRTRSAQVSATF